VLGPRHIQDLPTVLFLASDWESQEVGGDGLLHKPLAILNATVKSGTPWRGVVDQHV
jgi:hypothetical protein